MSLTLHSEPDTEKTNRIVFDTNIWISSARWEYSIARRLFKFLTDQKIPIFTCKEIMDEFQEVLLRDFELSAEEIIHTIQQLTPFISWVQITERITIVQTDPDDNKIIECAVAANAHYIVTYDPHLLNLKEFRGIKIVKPNELLRIL